MKAQLRSIVLVVVQLACLLYLLLTGYWFARHPWIWIELLGLIVTGWAVLTMKPHRISALPEPRHNMRLVTRGPYRWIRHPMYSGLLILTLALVLNTPRLDRIVVWLLLLADLLTKLEYEESLLTHRFPEYSAYRQRTRRLIPFVY